MNKIPDTVIERMVEYYCLIKRIHDGSLDKVISSEELASKTGVSAVTIRKDLSYFGKFGCKGVGYNIAELKKQLKKSLYIGNNRRNMIIIGAGNIGMALANYSGFLDMGINIAAILDCDLCKIGNMIGEYEIESTKDLREIIVKRDIELAVLAVPAGQAEELAKKCTTAGVKAIWNFAPVPLFLEGVIVRNVDLDNCIICLNYYLTKNIVNYREECF